MGVMTSDMTSDMTSQMAVNVPVAGSRVSVRRDMSPTVTARVGSSTRYSLQSRSSRTVDTLCNPTIVIHTDSDYLEDAVVADIVYGRAV